LICGSRNGGHSQGNELTASASDAALDDVERKYRDIARKLVELSRRTASPYMALMHLELAVHYDSLAELHRKYATDDPTYDRAPKS
jgi:hypothetical protein